MSTYLNRAVYWIAVLGLFLLFQVTSQAQRFLYSVNNFQELVALPVLPHTNIWVNWGYAQLDDLGGIFSYYSSSVTATNTTNCFKPLTRDGRYLKMLPQFFSGGGSAFADPSAKVGPVMVPGSATTGIRSDGAPAIDLEADYPWNGQHTFLTNGIFFGPTSEAWWGSQLDDGTIIVSHRDVVTGEYNYNAIYLAVEETTKLSEIDLAQTKDYSQGRWALATGDAFKILVTDALGARITLEDASAEVFEIEPDGNLGEIRNVTYAWPASQGAASTVLLNDGSGNLSWSSSAVPPSFAAPTTLVSLSSSAGTSTNALRADAGLDLDESIAPRWTESHDFSRGSLGTGTANSIRLINDTPSTALATIQNSPTLRFYGTYWNATDSASGNIQFLTYLEENSIGKYADLHFSSTATGTGANSLLNMIRFRSNGDVLMNEVATSATRNFLFIPASPGTPAGVPFSDSANSAKAINFDKTNNKLYVYNSGWQLIGPIINPTDGYVPYRASASSFGDSPIQRIDASTVQIDGTNAMIRFGGLTNVLYRSAGALVYTNQEAAFHFIGSTAAGSIGTGTGAFTLLSSNVALVLGNDLKSIVFTANEILPNSGDIHLGGSGTQFREIHGTNIFVQNRLYWNGPTNTVFDTAGFGTPEGVVTADSGSTYRRYDGGAATSFYVKETDGVNTGWVAK